MKTQREMEIALIESYSNGYIFWRALGQLLVLCTALVISLLLNA